MTLRLNTIAPAEGAKRDNLRQAVVSVLVLVRLVVVVSKVKTHVRAVVLVQVSKVVKLHFIVVCLNSVSLANWL